MAVSGVLHQLVERFDRGLPFYGRSASFIVARVAPPSWPHEAYRRVVYEDPAKGWGWDEGGFPVLKGNQGDLLRTLIYELCALADETALVENRTGARNTKEVGVHAR